MARWGAERSDWDHLTLVMGLDTELLPVVSNPQATIAPASKLKDIGKVPSVYDRARQVVGLAGWPSRRAVERELQAWRGEPDYGICLQCRTIRAIDADIVDAALAEEVWQAIEEYLGIAMPRRFRGNSPKFLLAFRLGGSFTKRVLRTAHGNIEFLADGQQFIACGTHSSGARYEWVGGLPDDFPALTAPQFESLWEYLTERFGVPGGAIVTRQGVARASKIVEAATGDPVAKYLVDNGWFLSNNRDGSFNIRCPNEAQHTTASNETATTYWPAHTGGFARGHFKCLHAHCADKSDHDFLQAIGFYATEFDVIEGRGPDDAPADDETPLVFPRNKTGNIIVSLFSLRRALDHEKLARAVIRWDDFRSERQIAYEGQAPRPFDDSDTVLLREHLETNIGFAPITPRMMSDALLSHCARHRTDSAIEWASALPAWDGVRRVETFAQRYWGTIDTPYHRAVSRYLWTALAGRVMAPGVKADMVIVLVGPQGKFKTESVKALAPTLDQFADIDLTLNEVERARLLRGKLVAELGELKGLSKREAAETKAWLSRSIDEWTPKYIEYAIKVPRRWVAIGTTNDVEFLDDETGERRWLPLTIGIIDLAALRRDRDQLWAEALAMFVADGVDFAEAERLAVEHHARHKVGDPWDDVIASWVESEGDDIAAPRSVDTPFTTGDVLFLALGIATSKVHKGDERRVAKALRRLGFEQDVHQTRVGSRRGRFWRRKQNE